MHDNLIYCTISYYRFSTEYRILGGLWYGTSKPDMSLFLKPLAKSLKNLFDNGIPMV